MAKPIHLTCGHIMITLTPNPTDPESDVLADSGSAWQHIAGLKNHFMSMFRRRVTVNLDLKDLLIEQVLLDLLRKEITTQSLRLDEQGSFNGKVADVFRQFEGFPAGGARITFPQYPYCDEACRVTLVIDRYDGGIIMERIIGHYKECNLGTPISLDYLAANLEFSKKETQCFPIASSLQFHRRDTITLKWPWDVTAKAPGQLICNVLLYKAGQSDLLQQRETAWPSFIPPSIKMDVHAKRISVAGHFLALVMHPYFLGIFSTILAALILHYWFGVG